MKSVELILICKKEREREREKERERERERERRERESLLQEANQIKSNITIFTSTFSMQWYFHINCISSLYLMYS